MDRRRKKLARLLPSQFLRDEMSRNGVEGG